VGPAAGWRCLGSGCIRTHARHLQHTSPRCAQAVLGTLGVRAEYTTTNHIMEVQQFLGIGERAGGGCVRSLALSRGELLWSCGWWAAVAAWPALLKHTAWMVVMCIHARTRKPAHSVVHHAHSPTLLHPPHPTCRRGGAQDDCGRDPDHDESARHDHRRPPHDAAGRLHDLQGRASGKQAPS